jgi:hypothetical protein
LAAKLEVAMALSDGMKVIAGDLARVLEVAKEGRLPAAVMLGVVGAVLCHHCNSGGATAELQYRQNPRSPDRPTEAGG